MWDARAVANHFLDLADASRQPITVLTLLKVLYFAHAWHLVRYGTPLVGQPFEAWKHGPVNRVVYDQFRDLGKQTISSRCQVFDPEIPGYIEAKAEFDAEIYKLLQDVFRYYSRFDPLKLSDLTHEKGSPWDEVWQRAERQAVPGMQISNERIREWFAESSSRWYTNREQGLPI